MLNNLSLGGLLDVQKHFQENGMFFQTLWFALNKKA
jgi:hypothetical protein